MAEDILKDQLDYYRARAGEYDHSVQQFKHASLKAAVEAEQVQIRAALHGLPHGKEALELACGTGIWTQELLAITDNITALDGAPEMLDLNRLKLGDSSRIRYECIDLFTWQPGRSYDLVFFAFWLSHIPLDKLGVFLEKVTRATRVGGQVFIVDEPASGRQLSGITSTASTQTRQLLDGRSFQVVKAYYDLNALQRNLAERGFGSFKTFPGEYFFSLQATRTE